MTGAITPTLLAFIRETFGINPDALGPAAVQAALRDSMAELGETDANAFVERLWADPAAQLTLGEHLIVPETWFYRDVTPFEFLGTLARNHPPTRPLRILSAPCSTGEEPYSIAMTLLQAGLNPDQFVIEAADLSPHALAQARRACYGPHSFRTATPDLSPFFEPGPDGTRQLRADLRALVQFHQANLLDPDAFAQKPLFDIIFCRNVLIYLEETARAQVVALISRLLLPHGHLFVGHAELLPLFGPHFSRVPETSAFAYQFRPLPAGSTPPPPPSPKPKPTSKPAGAPAPNLPPEAPTATLPPPPLVPLASSEPQTVPWSEARHLADRGDYRRALALAEACLQKDRTSPELHFLIGTIRLALGDENGARVAFSKTLYLEPRHPEALLHAALLAERHGDARAAAQFRARSARLRPSVSP